MVQSKVQISKKIVGINSLSFAIVRVLQMTVFVWVQHFLLQMTPPEEYSIYAIIGSISFLFPVFGRVFLSSSSRYVIKYIALDDTDKANAVISTVVPLLLLVSFLLGMAMLVVGLNIGKIFVISEQYYFDARIMLTAVTVMLLVNMVFVPLTLGINVKQKFVHYNIILVIGEALKLAMLCAFLLGVSARAFWVPVSYAIASIFCLVCRIIVSHRLLPELKMSLSGFDVQLIPKLLSFGLWNSFIQLSKYLRDHAVLLILNRFCVPLQVASFALGRSIYRQLFLLWEPVRASLGSSLIAMHATNQEQKLKNSFVMGGRYAFWLTMIFATPIIIFRNEFVVLYAGEQYLQAGNILLIMLIPIPFQMIAIVLPQIAQAKAKLKGLAVRVLLIESCMLLAVYIAVKYISGTIIQAASIFAFFNIAGEVLLVWGYACRLANVTVREMLSEIIIPGVVPVFFGATAWVLCQRLLVVNTWSGLFLGVSGGIVFYLGGILLSLRPNDKKNLIFLIGKFLKARQQTAIADR